MSASAWVTCITIGGAIFALVRNLWPPDFVLLGALTLLLGVGVFGRDSAMALGGFANAGTITVGALFVVAAGLQETGALAFMGQRVFGRPKTVRQALVRMMFPVGMVSAVLNNTPVVAMFIPVVTDWARKNGLSVSKLLMPLSYAAIFGGVCTLIGTSTNLVVYGLLLSYAPSQHLGFFDIAWVGLPCALLSIPYVVVAQRWLLPERRPAVEQLENPKEYSVEMMVMPDSPVAGKTIEQAGLRNLPGLYLAEIDRGGALLAAVGPEESIRAGDRLIFVGVVESIADLQKIKGLVPAPEQVFKLSAPRSDRCLAEAVISSTSPLVGLTVRDGRFRTIYNAAIIAVYRGDERLRGKIGDIVLRPGDTLLLETHPEFVTQHRNSRDFFLVSAVSNSAPLRHDRARYALGVLVLLVALLTFRWVSTVVAALLAAGLMVALRCLPADSARKSIDWSVLLVIAAAFGLGKALEVSGAAAAIAGGVIHGIAGSSPTAALLVVYLVTNVLTEVLSNAAAAALIFPLGVQVAAGLGVSVLPFTVAIMIAASGSFSTPIGYQTNLMVYGPGGYRFTDYTRFGLPLNVLWATVTTLLTPYVFPF